MRSPAFPAGSLFMSSGLAWMTRAAPTGGQRLRTRAHRHSGVDDGRLRRAIRCNRHIVHVACVRTGRVLQPVLLGRWIEMRAGRLERGRIARGRLVQVNSMFAGREPLEVELECDTRRAIRLERRRPDDRPASIPQSDLFRILGNEDTPPAIVMLNERHRARPDRFIHISVTLTCNVRAVRNSRGVHARR